MKKSAFLSAVLAAGACLCLLAAPASASVLRGDCNGDGSLTSADAVQLLRSTLLPEQYASADPDTDYNGDGEFNSGDAVYLLRHVMMPELYPLAGGAEAAEETEQIRASVESTLKDLAYRLSFDAAYPDKLTSSWLEEKTADALGLSEDYTVKVDDAGFAELRDGYIEHYLNGDYTHPSLPFTVSGPKGGAAEFSCSVYLRARQEDYVKNRMIERISAAGIWNGKLSSEGDVTLEIGTEVLSADLLAAALAEQIDFSGMEYGAEVSVIVEDNEWVESIDEMYQDAEIGEEVEEWLDVIFTGLTQDDEENNVYRVKATISICVRFGVTKTVPESGFCEDEDGNTCYYLFGEKQTGWRFIDGEYYFFDEDGTLVPDKPVPDGLSKNFDAEEDGIVLVKDGKVRFTLLYDPGLKDFLRDAADPLIGFVEEFTGEALPLTNRALFNPEGAENRQSPVIIIGRGEGEDLADTGLFQYSIKAKGSQIILGAWCDWLIDESVEKLVSLMRDGISGDDIIIDVPDLVCDSEAMRNRRTDPGRNRLGQFTVTYYLGPTPEEIVADEQIVADMAALGITRLQLDAADPSAARAASAIAAKYGLEVEFYQRGRLEWRTNKSREDGNYIDPADQEQAVMWSVYDYQDVGNLVQWYLCDEPVVKYFESIRDITDAFHKYSDLPVLVNLLPGWDDAIAYRIIKPYTYLDYLANALDDAGADMITFDRYPFYYGDRYQAVYNDPQYIRNMLEFKYVTETHCIPAGMIIQQAGGQSPQLYREQFRWETNLSLAYGFNYISYFLYDYRDEAEGFRGVLDENKRPNLSYDELKAGTSDSFAFGRYLADKKLVMAMHKNTEENNCAPEYFPYHGLGEITTNDKAVISWFDGEDGEVIFFVNFEWQSGKENGRYSLDDLGGASLEAYDPASESWKPAEQLADVTRTEKGYDLNLEAGAAILLRIVNG